MTLVLKGPHQILPFQGFCESNMALSLYRHGQQWVRIHNCRCDKLLSWVDKTVSPSTQSTLARHERKDTGGWDKVRLVGNPPKREQPHLRPRLKDVQRPKQRARKAKDPQYFPPYCRFVYHIEKAVSHDRQPTLRVQNAPFQHYYLLLLTICLQELQMHRQRWHVE